MKKYVMTEPGFSVGHLSQLHDVFEKLGCNMIGYTSQEGYEHESSKAIRGDKFCGLLCDEINQDDLTVERVQKWVAQLKAEGILDSKSQVKADDGKDSFVGEDPNPVVVNGQQDLISKLEEENSRLRKMLEDSKIMDQVLKEEIMDESYTPHYNPKSGVTMWTSVDGKKCYFTRDAPKTP
jgi:flavodoxin I